MTDDFPPLPDPTAPVRLSRPDRRRLLTSLLALGMPIPAAAGDFPGTSFDYPAVSPATRLSFPADYGAHPSFRIEWWYLTGWLQAGTATMQRHWGFQLTFFRVRTAYPDGNPSRFSPQRLVIGHAALADGRAGRHHQHHRLLNQGSPGVRLAPGDTDCAIPGWRLVRGSDDRYRTTVDEEHFGWALDLTPPQPQPWLQGRDGFSRKGPRPDQASHYYSRPQLRVSGRLRPDDDRRAPLQTVKGIAWLDHEWSSTLLDDRASGWDWAGLNLHDGRALVWFRIRHSDGSDDALFGYLALREADGTTRILSEPALSLDEHWRSPATGAVYPVALSLEPAAPAPTGLSRLSLRPLLPNQEVDARTSTANAYWEGAVRVLDAGGAEIGLGYLELTGYHRTIRL